MLVLKGMHSVLQMGAATLQIQTRGIGRRISLLPQ